MTVIELSLFHKGKWQENWKDQNLIGKNFY